MVLDLFHPAVAAWFGETFGAPTPVQEKGWPAIRSGKHTLISAPTGSGKTLTAFLNAIDALLAEGAGTGSLPDEVRVVYVSPLKALSHDIHANLAEPRRGVRGAARRMHEGIPRITAAVRTGDTPSRERAAMLRTPPHILVTTPESLYLLLTAERSREMLRTVRTVIVDEIHAVVESRRGCHLALSLERLEHVAAGPIQRIGLSATQRPIGEVARFLVGDRNGSDEGKPDCVIIDEGHSRRLELNLEVPESPLDAVMSTEVWGEVIDRLVQLIASHETTLVFVNTRRMAERVSKQLSDRLGHEHVAAHHGSLSREKRLGAEARLRDGDLSVMVATASLELGIDIGHVDAVCQIGSTRKISTFLQRVGRSGHTVRGTPRGYLFPLSRDELMECVALIRAVSEGELDNLIPLEQPLDVLAQQIVAEAAAEDRSIDDLYESFRRAFPYRHLSSEAFEGLVETLGRGYVTSRGRRGALVHVDGINRRVRGRRGSRLMAITAGGAIPDNADYRVLHEPGDTYVGTVNEDFAVESSVGDIFQLGNTSWRILKIESGAVRVADAQGEPPNIPFWFGEAPGRSLELSASISRLRMEVAERLSNGSSVADWLKTEVGVPRPAAVQIEEYVRSGKDVLGAVPSQDHIILERFFDESGGMQLVLHAPFGSRINRAWGLSLRKKFCRSFNFELQAAATEDAVLLSLGPQHSFPLDDVFRYLSPQAVRNTLIQAMVDSPLFLTRWRWVATISLAVLRNRGGRKVPPQLQRMQADDLLAAVFPDAAACLENIGGDRVIPDHPLVGQTIYDCLNEAMDLDGLTSLLEKIHAGEITCTSRDTPEPSAFCHDILNASPYAFLDPAPLEERRTQAVLRRRALEPSRAEDIGALDEAAIDRVREEAWPMVRDADELHEALLLVGAFDAEEIDDLAWSDLFQELVDAGRAECFEPADTDKAFWISAEKAASLREAWTIGDPDAILDLIRGRMLVSGPVTEARIADRLAMHPDPVRSALLALEVEGSVLRGYFTAGGASLEWCDRSLLSRIHRYTLNRLRSEIRPVDPASFMRFLFNWQKVESDQRVRGIDGLLAIVEQLDGYEIAASGWETDVLSIRVEDYDPAMLDALCLTGRVSWSRLSMPARSASGATTGPIRSTPVALYLREHAPHWFNLAGEVDESPAGNYARKVLAALDDRGASFFPEIVSETGLLATQVEDALSELVGLRLVNSDAFGGLRVLLTPSNKRRPLIRGARRRGRTVPFGMEIAGRWSRTTTDGRRLKRVGESLADDEALNTYAWALLRRYGVVFRRLLARETNLPPWREMTLIYRRLEAQGEIRGGRFVTGVSGEQFALPEAVGLLRRIRRNGPDGSLVSLSAADPLNLTGIITPESRVPSLPSNRVVYRDGIPAASLVAGDIRILIEVEGEEEQRIRRALQQRSVSPALLKYWGIRRNRKETGSKTRGRGAAVDSSDPSQDGPD